MNSIKVLGTGCPTRKRLLSDVEALVQQKNWQAEVEYVTDIADIMAYGVISMPVIVINFWTSR